MTKPRTELQRVQSQIHQCEADMEWNMNEIKYHSEEIERLEIRATNLRARLEQLQNVDREYREILGRKVGS